MRNRIRLAMFGLVGLAALADAPAHAQTFDSGSTGADGPFSPTANVTVTLPPNGVFNYTTVNIPAGVTVRFTKNTANTPVTFLASGNVTVAGTIDVAGAPGPPVNGFTTNLGRTSGAGGPGGFDGGNGATGIASTRGGSGLGPGGGGGAAGDGANGGGAGFLNAGVSSDGAGGSAYGTPALLPLVGGSGGGGGGAQFGHTGGGGGGGGGALLIASSGTITFSGTILAKGGDGVSSGVSAAGGGSGGAVRLVATSIVGSGGTINVNGGGGIPGSAGRVRIEGFSYTVDVNLAGVPAAAVSSAAPTSVTLANTPTLAITAVAGIAAPAAPAGSFTAPDITLPAGTANPVSVSLAGANIPIGTTVTVTVKGQTGSASSATATLAGTQASSTASASVTIPTNQPSVISASASFTLIAASGSGPVYVQGEEVEQVRVSVGFGGPSQVAYVTKSGREIVVTPGR